MLKRTVLLVGLLASVVSSAQTTLEQTRSVATFCKVWGFLKYYHPTVAKGDLDWDRAFTVRVKQVAALHNREERSLYYADWIRSLGEVKPCKKCTTEVPDSLTFNLDLGWLEDTAVFTPALIAQLKWIQKNRNQGKNYYVQQSPGIKNTSFEYEKTYPDSVFPSPELRLLGLARYWNVVNYFFPYKYVIGQNWDEALHEMVPKFSDAPDTLAYHLAMLELVVKLNDTHAGFVTPYTNQHFGLKWAPFRTALIDGVGAVVTGFYNDSLCKKDDIRMGDAFLKVEDLDVYKIIEKQAKYISGSNESVRLRNCYYAIFNGAADSVVATFERDGVVSKKVLHRYFFKQFQYKTVNNTAATFEILDGNIGYVNLGLLQPQEVDGVLQQLRNTKAIIFDVRNYPNGTMYQIAKFLNAEPRPFAKFSYPDLSYPGVYQYTEPIDCGKKNKHPYAGRVVLLFNEFSQSHAEFTLMALQTAPNVTCIGSQTSGADGNVSEITFPGNYTTRFSGIGVYYPDGRETQRIGIVPDIEVKPTRQGLQAGRDEVLEKALEVINGH